MAFIFIPHDITDEGVDEIKSRLRYMRDIKYVFAEVNTIFERNPVPVGVLPHNPIHAVVMEMELCMSILILPTAPYNNKNTHH